MSEPPDGVVVPDAEGHGRATTVLVAVCGVAIAAGFVLRFVASTPMWLDEALSVEIASLSPGDLVEALRRDGHPPLYYLLLHAWMQVVGTSDVAVRALSGLFAAAALVPLWLLARRRGGRDLAVVAVAMFAMSPFAVRYATEARMYSLVMLEVLVAAVLIDSLLSPMSGDPSVAAGRRAERTGGGRWPRLAGVALLSGSVALTHYWGIFVVVATVLVLAVVAWRSDGAPARRSVVEVMAALAAGGVLFLPWLGTFLYQAAHTGTPWAPASRPGAMVGITLRDLAAGDVDEALLGVAMLGALLLLGLSGRAVDARHVELDAWTRPLVRVEAAVVAVTLTIGASVSLLAGSAFSSRYASVVAPFIVLVAAVGVTTLVDARFRLGALGVVLAVSAAGIADQLTTDRTQAAQIAAAVRTTLDDSSAGPPERAIVIYCPDQLGPAGSRALNGPPTLGGAPSPVGDRVAIDERVYPTGDRPGLVDWVDYAERNAAADPGDFAATVLADAAADGSVFLVWDPSYDTFEGQCEALRATLAAARPGLVDIVVNDPAAAFEHAAVTWFPPVSP